MILSGTPSARSAASDQPSTMGGDGGRHARRRGGDGGGLADGLGRLTGHHWPDGRRQTGHGRQHEVVVLVVEEHRRHPRGVGLDDVAHQIGGAAGRFGRRAPARGRRHGAAPGRPVPRARAPTPRTGGRRTAAHGCAATRPVRRRSPARRPCRRSSLRRRRSRGRAVSRTSSVAKKPPRPPCWTRSTCVMVQSVPSALAAASCASTVVYAVTVTLSPWDSTSG